MKIIDVSNPQKEKQHYFSIYIDNDWCFTTTFVHMVG